MLYKTHQPHSDGLWLPQRLLTFARHNLLYKGCAVFFLSVLHMSICYLLVLFFAKILVSLARKPRYAGLSYSSKERELYLLPPTPLKGRQEHHAARHI